MAVLAHFIMALAVGTVTCGVGAFPYNVEEDSSCSLRVDGKPSESFIQQHSFAMAKENRVPLSMSWQTPGASSQLPQLSALPRVLIVCLMLLLCAGVTYLLLLWRQRGLLAHFQGILQHPRSAKGALSLLAYLGLLVALDLTIKREAELGGGHYATSPFLLVGAVEFGKLMITLALCVWQPVGVKAAHDGIGENHQLCCTLPTSVALQMLPVAMIFNINNLLNFLVLSLVRLDAYAVWRNVSILFNAIMWVWVLNKRLETHRWVAITICAMGCSFNSLSVDGHWDFDVAVLGVLLTAFLSSMASVLNEKVIKSANASDLTIDQLNLILYAETLGLMLAGIAVYLTVFKPEVNLSMFSLLNTFTAGSIKIILVQIALGLCVSRVLKYADAVAKTVVGSLRDVVIVFLAPHVVSATRFDFLSVGSACLVGVAGMIYFAPSGGGTLDEPKEDAAKVSKREARPESAS